MGLRARAGRQAGLGEVISANPASMREYRPAGRQAGLGEVISANPASMCTCRQAGRQAGLGVVSSANPASVRACKQGSAECGAWSSGLQPGSMMRMCASLQASRAFKWCAVSPWGSANPIGTTGMQLSG